MEFLTTLNNLRDRPSIATVAAKSEPFMRLMERTLPQKAEK
jgi:hypothetical protein